MPRTIWKGAVSLGLVHIPVGLMPATVNRGIDFDWLDRRTLDPVGYKRINKTTGKEIGSEDVVRGVQYEKGRYVVLSDDEIRAAYPEATQTIDIQAFVLAGQIPFLYLDTPYYLVPEKRGGKAYALLRRVLEESGRLALASVVLHTRQRLSVLVPWGTVLVLHTLRWREEVRGVEELGPLEDTLDARVEKRELEMARRLVEDMSEDWDPALYADSFTTQIMELVDQKARQGELKTVEPVEAGKESRGADIIDLAELLKRSLGKALRKPESEGKGSARATAKKGKTPSPGTSRAPRRSGTGTA